MTGKDVLPEKVLLEKAAAKKNIWRFFVRQGIKSTNWHYKETVSKLDDTYNSDYSFNKYVCNIKKFENLSLKSKYLFLAKFWNDLNKFNKLKPQKEETQRQEQMSMIKLQSHVVLARNLLPIYFKR